MLDLEMGMEIATSPVAIEAQQLQVAVIWIDWYAYHVARFRGLCSAPALRGAVAGIELVGGIGVHAGLRFREDPPAGLSVHTLLPEINWEDAGQLRLAGLLWRYLQQLQPQIVLVPGYYTLPAIAAALWARIHRRESVLMTESTLEDHKRNATTELAKRLLLRTLFTSAVAGGKRHRRYLEHLGFPAERTLGFYDVVDNQSLSQACAMLRSHPRDSYGLPRPYFLYVGRLAVEKNIHNLIHAYLAYREQGGTWPLVLVGDGPERASLEMQSRQSAHAADIRFIGHKASAELPLYYAFAGCFVLPSTREPWGLVVNEAMACGLPIIVSECCGCADDLVASGENGYVFSPHTPGALLNALTCMAAYPEEERQRMGARSEQIIANYTPEHFGAEIAKLSTNYFGANETFRQRA